MSPAVKPAGVVVSRACSTAGICMKTMLMRKRGIENTNDKRNFLYVCVRHRGKEDVFS